MVSYLPWHEETWSRLTDPAVKLHHGMIFSGSSGIGKREFSVALAQQILCSEVDASIPCGTCQNCKLFVAGTHPDFHVITSEFEAVEGRIKQVSQYSDRYQDIAARDKKVNPSQVIPIDQIRTLIGRFYQSSHISESRVALILPADRMNVNAANALLKLLEEPPSGAFFLLVTDQPGLLPATIRSRCVNESLRGPTRNLAREWINARIGDADSADLFENAVSGPIDIVRDYQNGVVLLQLENLKRIDALVHGRLDPVDMASQMTKQDVLVLLNWMHRIVFDLIKWKLAGQVPAWSGQTSLNIDRVSTTKLDKLYDKLAQYRRMAREQLNFQLALEEIFISLQQAARLAG